MPALFALDSGWQGSGELGQDIPGFLLLPADDLLSLNLPWVLREGQKGMEVSLATYYTIICSLHVPHGQC